NRELSWLEFNRRVLEEAQDPSVPLLERVKFLAIFSSNLDEFFMVRVAALRRGLAAGDQTPGLDGLLPADTLAAIATRAHELVDDVIRPYLPSVYGGYDVLSSHAIRVTRDADLPARGRRHELLASIEEGLLERSQGAAVRLQHDADVPADVLASLVEELELGP